MTTPDSRPPRLSRSAKKLRRYQPVLERQVDDADQILHDVHRRMPALAAKVTAPSTATRGHLERAILPGAALYLELRDRFGKERALALTGDCFAADAQLRARLINLLDKTPWAFPIFRQLLKTLSIGGVWTLRRIENTPQRVRMDVTQCYYVDTLKTLGIPELTALYCRNDDLRFGNLRHVAFYRTSTLATGDRCDFCFERRRGDKRDAPAEQAGA